MAGWLATHFSRTAARAGLLLFATALTGCASGGHGAPHVRNTSAAAFLAGYARPDGRVTRPDQGGDTVSEGQAYGLLLASAVGDDAAFGRIWQWTREHLQRGDGLFAYHADAAGHVLDRQSASDADVLIAWALLRYQGPHAADRHAAGRRVAAAVLAHEVTNGWRGWPVLTAGPWANGRPATLNPSYWSLPAFRGLASLAGDPRWRRLADTAVSVTRQVTQDGRLLPPDWVKLTADGHVAAEPAPDGTQSQPQYGLDAQRTVVWFATTCDPQARALAARWWALLRPGERTRAIALRPDGAPLNADGAVLPLVAAAAAARAAGDSGHSNSLLYRAAARQRSYPTYYGAAWAALGPVLLAATPQRSC